MPVDPLVWSFYCVIMPALFLGAAMLIRTTRRLSDLDKLVIAMILLVGAMVILVVAP